MMIDWLIFKLIIFFMFEQLFSLFILSITKLDEKILNKLFKERNPRRSFFLSFSITICKI
jgi:hypothetical protein